MTGRLGGAGAALAVMEGRAGHGRNPQTALDRARNPWPRLSEGRALAQAGVHAMIDLTDGVATDAGHIGRASGLRLRVNLADLPLEQDVAEICAELGMPPWQLAACAGEDYELCFCTPPDSRTRTEQAVSRAGAVGVAWIGEVVEGPPGVTLLDPRGDEVRLEGFEHRW